VSAAPPARVPLAERLIAGIGFVVTLPVVALAGVVVILTDGWPPIFRQQRAGVGGKPFTVVKLRTMRRNLPPPEEVGQVGAGHTDVLPIVGDVYRRARLDEVPQLLNVMRGEMRLVGPRPALVSDARRYGWPERHRLEVPPGMTGWAQVNGNTSLSWDDRIALDLYYVDNRSPLLDLQIIFRTIVTVVRGERENEANLRKAREHAHRLARSRQVDGGSA
jgi:lipopolysaccharide/colanic/teichoic acid biosynthesis glycosyltransferase